MKKYKIVIFIFIIALGIFFRFFRLNETPLGLYPDEAMNGNNALEAQATYDYKIFYQENNGREGLFINMQAVSLALFEREPWALRGVSAVMGVLTIWGVFLVTKELFSQRGNKRKRSAATTVALIAAFFIATSYWHINFSRIGFRAIMFPLLTAFALYFLLKGLRTKNIWTLVCAGFVTGLGFHTYIAFRFFPFVAAIPIIGEVWHYYRTKPVNKKTKTFDLSCSPCAIALYLFVTFVIALPIGVYFLQNPQDFIGRSSQVSVFAAESPIKTFIESNIKTWGMFVAHGDCNWRHNYDCQPALIWPLAFFFVIGIFVTIRDLFKRTYERSSVPLVLLGWLIIMSLPATLTWEGLPHALRSIGMIPPVMILSAFGCWRLTRALLDWFERQKSRFPEKISQLARVQKELKILVMLLLLIVPISSYRNYFNSWANIPDTYSAFATDLYHIGQYLRDKPADVSAYVVVNMSGTEVRGIPMPAQTVMFVTDTFREAERIAKHITYLRTDQLDQIRIQEGQKTMIVFLNGDDKKTLSILQKKFPDFKTRAPGDFIILENYF
ncbi:MAG: glycosyltransferase family 39 protein [Aquabacterium sp.]|uniref:glycosyltransferase family 39 protein n=1 Tax=Aquabacterium sp. TaxID=1872578 RepID=UPI003BB07DCA